jgi:hypothetical protein
MTPGDPLTAGPRVTRFPEPHATASWYTQGHSDGIGDRLLMFDDSSTPSLELLRFRPELAASAGFEPALRDRVERLHNFRHPAFAELRAVAHLEGTQELTLVSTFTRGKRLSDVVRTLRPALHPAFAAWLLRELTPALDDLQAYGDGIGHGALTADRIVFTQDRRLVIVEHALGPALAGLRWSAARLWRDLGVVSTPGGSLPSLVGTRDDVVQLGLIALSLLIGRPITPSEYPARLDTLLDEFSDTSGPRSPALVPALRQWLEQALGTRGVIFQSTADARDALDELGAQNTGFAPEFFPPREGAPVPPPIRIPAARRALERDSGLITEDLRDPRIGLASRASPPENELESDMKNPAVSPGGSSEHRAAGGAQGNQREEPLILNAFSPEAMSEPRPAPVKPNREAGSEVRPIPAPVPKSPPPPPPSRLAQRLFIDQAPAPEDPSPRPAFDVAPMPSRRSSRRRGRMAALLAAVAVIEAGVIGALLYTRPAPAAPPAFPMMLESPQSGDTVLINGQAVGVTPLMMTLTPDMRTLEIQRPPEPAPLATAAPRAESRAPPTPAETAIAEAAARQRSGGLRLSSPIEIQVLEGDRVLGSSANGPIVAKAGRHDLEFINSTFGYRSRQQVEIKPNQIIDMTITPPPGRVSINVTPWAQVSINGTAVGETPLANLPMPVGEHQVTFRHPQLGERTEKFIIRPSSLTRVSATLGQ